MSDQDGGDSLAFSFAVEATDGAARAGRMTTPHGVVETPTFMPVGTVGSVKGIEMSLLEATGARIVLGNTYHLTLRPGEERVRKLGGLHRFTGWTGPMLTDSGGFQLFSLAQRTKIREEGAEFQSHIDGRRLTLSPERSVAIQEALGSDIAMVLDHVAGLPNTDDVIHDAMLRTIRWARRSQDAHHRADQVQFAIVQGGLRKDFRLECAEALVAMDFPGYAVGGLSVGEAPEKMYETLDYTTPALPFGKPRYLMGVGTPVDLLEGIARGIDMFDCVMPTRNGRNAMAFTDHGPIKMRNLKYIDDAEPLEAGCPCPACRRSRAYLRHLFVAQEMLGPILLSIHNITYYERLVSRARVAIRAGQYAEFVTQRKRGWGMGE
ncbi:MAG: tRNA guanosine(34) transglycosylase Tgt [Planctomycetia bacterium]|nr:tRNA guanosine(34) transglycosylase Tgt [Planctomycetia bacterium]